MATYVNTYDTSSSYDTSGNYRGEYVNKVILRRGPNGETVWEYGGSHPPKPVYSKNPDDYEYTGKNLHLHEVLGIFGENGTYKKFERWVEHIIGPFKDIPRVCDFDLCELPLIEYVCTSDEFLTMMNEKGYIKMLKEGE